MGKGTDLVIRPNLGSKIRLSAKPDPRINRDERKRPLPASTEQVITFPQELRGQYERQVTAERAHAQAAAKTRRDDVPSRGHRRRGDTNSGAGTEETEALRAAARELFEENAILAAEAVAASKIFDLKREQSDSCIEFRLEDFERFCSERLVTWKENMKHCEKIKWKLWTSNQNLAADLAKTDLDGQKVDARRLEVAYQKFIGQKHRLYADNGRRSAGSKSGGTVLGRAVKRQILWWFIGLLSS